MLKYPAECLQAGLRNFSGLTNAPSFRKANITSVSTDKAVHKPVNGGDLKPGDIPGKVLHHAVQVLLAWRPESLELCRFRILPSRYQTINNRFKNLTRRLSGESQCKYSIGVDPACPGQVVQTPTCKLR